MVVDLAPITEKLKQDMALHVIRLKNLRNIAEGELRPRQGLNCIEGPNGSGKSSLLEAIYILGRGRSFRHSRISPIIKYKEKALEIFGESDRNGTIYRIGIRKTADGTQVKINGTPVKKLSLLARELPVHLIAPNTHELIEGRAEFRRRFLEWGVFHVEHRYQSCSFKYHRILAQRNAALKQRDKSLEYWNAELSKLADEIDGYRVAYISRLKPVLKEELEHLIPNQQISITWKRGWSKELCLESVLDKNLSLDFKRGYTCSGPHRADIQITSKMKPASELLSRGQQKLVVSAIIFAQMRVLRDQTDLDPVLLVDDFASELDNSNRERLLNRIKQQGTQVFLTTTDRDLLGNVKPDKMFHVEHGAVSEEGV